MSVRQIFNPMTRRNDSAESATRGEIRDAFGVRVWPLPENPENMALLVEHLKKRPAR